MIKKITLLAAMCLMFFGAARADEQRKVKLNNSDTTKKQIELPYGNIFLTVSEEDKDGQAEVVLEIENTHETCVLVLFGQTMDEKQLKKQTGITFDKTFPGQKGKRSADATTKMKTTSIPVPPSERMEVARILVDNGETEVIDMPIYIAKAKDKKYKKLILMEKEVQQLEIEVSMKPDEVLQDITNRCETLPNEIKGATFCTNKNHKGTSAAKLKESYAKQLQQLKDDIQKAMSNCAAGGKKAKNYQEMLSKIEAIDIESIETVSSCGKDATPKKEKKEKPKCKYEGSSYQKLYNTLDGLYQKIYGGKTTKKKVMAEVNAIYNCANSHNHWSTGAEYKSGITRIYNKINALP